MKTKKLPALSVFFPAYNEAGNIEEVVKQALTVLPSVAEKFEILIVNDGSTDSTLPISKRLAKRYKSVRVINQPHSGYGAALKNGFKSARYDWVFFSDSDLQFDLGELKKFIKYTHDYNLVLGYRKNRVEGWKRQMLAIALKMWNKLFLSFPLRIRDIDCAFKLIHKRVIRTVSPLVSDGAMLSTEFLLKAHEAGFTYKQIGVTHYARRSGHPTGNNVGVIAKAVKETFMLREAIKSTRPTFSQVTAARLQNLRGIFVRA